MTRVYGWMPTWGVCVPVGTISRRLRCGPPSIQVVHERPTPTVDGRQPVAAQGDLVLGGRVALVAVELPLRVVLGLLAHVPITDHLRQHRRGGDGGTRGVGLDHGDHQLWQHHIGELRSDRSGFAPLHPRHRELLDHRIRRIGASPRAAAPDLGRSGAQQVPWTVHHQGARSELQSGQGPVGGQPPGQRHPPPVALGRAGMAHGGVGTPPGDVVEDRLAPVLGQHLGVAEPVRHRPGADVDVHHRHPDRQRTRPCTASDLVAARHPTVARPPQAPFHREARPANAGRRAAGAGAGAAGPGDRSRGRGHRLPTVTSAGHGGIIAPGSGSRPVGSHDSDPSEGMWDTCALATFQPAGVESHTWVWRPRISPSG